MSPDRWSRVKQLFEAGLEVPTGDRSRWLAEVCGPDKEVRDEVESLLAFEFGSTVSLECAVLQAAHQAQSGPSEIGQRFGSYEVVRELGHGGMGTVYLAVRADDQYRRQVAIKVVRRGMDSDSALLRFRTERRILGNLNHPNIAAIIDSGATADGRPYFVMEYIEGESLIQYCRSRSLDVRERLELFRQVVAAVHHAHQKLVIHRDLKPGNILVTADGIPKLLDFGIAKLTAPDTSTSEAPRTETSVRLLTPDYASPEQIRNEEITTATDVYSLGVLLFELLTEQRPFAAFSPVQLEQAVCNQQPPRPSEAPGTPARFRREIAGDLDNIVLMAMRKEPSRRYLSAGQFAEDIDRYLQGRPILARKDTLSYRATKFIRRNKAMAMSAALVAFSLIIGICVATWQAQRAERRFQQLRRLANTFVFDIHDEIEALPGSTPARKKLVSTALVYLDSLASEAGNDTELLLDLAAAYQRVAHVQGAPGARNLGQIDEALANYGKSVEILEGMRRRGVKDPRLFRALVAGLYRMASVQMHKGQSSEGLASLAQSLRISRSYTHTSPEDFIAADGLYQFYGDALQRTGDVAGAAGMYRKALANIAERKRRFPSEQVDRALALTYGKMGDALVELGDLEGALANYRQALPISLREAEEKPNDVAILRTVMVRHLQIGNALGNPYNFNLGRTREALEEYALGLRLAEKLAEADPKNILFQRDVCLIYRRMGALLKESDPPRSEQMIRKALAIAERLAQQVPGNVDYQRSIALYNESLADPVWILGRRKEALGYLRRALSLQHEMALLDPKRPHLRQDLTDTYVHLGDFYLELANFREAERHFARAVEIAERLAEDFPGTMTVLSDLADTYEATARLYVRMRETEAARAWYGKSLRVWANWQHKSQYQERRRQAVQSALERLS